MRLTDQNDAGNEGDHDQLRRPQAKDAIEWPNSASNSPAACDQRVHQVTMQKEYPATQECVLSPLFSHSPKLARGYAVCTPRAFVGLV